MDVDHFLGKKAPFFKFTGCLSFLSKVNKGNFDGLVKSPSIPHSGRVGVEPFEFTSNGGGGVALLRRVTRRRATFCEVINIDLHQIFGINLADYIEGSITQMTLRRRIP